MRRLKSAAIAVVVTCAAACGVPTESRARVTVAEDVPFALLERSSPPDTEVESASPVADTFGAYFVRSGLLVEVPASLAAPIAPDEAMELLLDGPDADARRRGLRTALVGDETIRSMRSSGGTVTVDLGADFSSLAPREQLLGLAQVVLTLTTLRGIGSVNILLDGKRTEVRVGDGSLRPGPVARDDYTVLLAP